MSVSFTAQDVRILLVDSADSGLLSAQEFFSPYKMKLDFCNCSRNAISAVRNFNYDMVFLNHIMPEMSGIEVMEIIRTMDMGHYQHLPIIALTENINSVLKEIIPGKKFNDLLLKPIDEYKLEKVLTLWIPIEKRNSLSSQVDFDHIYGLDTVKGSAMAGGKPEQYRKVLALFAKDVRMRLYLLSKIPNSNDLAQLTSHVHAIKGASASIGAVFISNLASELEITGKAGNLDLFIERLPVFYSQLEELINNIEDALKKSENELSGTGIKKQQIPLALLTELDSALGEQNVFEIDRIMEEIDKMEFDSNHIENIENISDHILMADYDSAREITKKLLSNTG